MKTIILILFAALAFSQAPAPLTDAEKAAVLDRLAEKYADDAAEAEVREQLQQLAQQKLTEARAKRQQSTAAVEAEVKKLIEARGLKADEWALDRKMQWRKREKPAPEPAKTAPAK